MKEILNPLILVDPDFKERLVYGTTNGKIIIAKLPYFTDIFEKSCIEKRSSVPLMLTPDRRVLVFYHTGPCFMGDWVTNIPQEGKEFPNLIGLIRRR